MMPTTSGSGSGSNYTTPRFSGGEFVFGFFLDGDNGQQPVIIGILGNSTQTLLSKSLPSVGFKPFTGHTNGKSVPSHELKSSKQIQKMELLMDHKFQQDLKVEIPIQQLVQRFQIPLTLQIQKDLLRI